MDVFVVVALVGVALLLAELLLSTGGVLAALGAFGLIAGGVLALTADADSSASDWAGPALITLGVLSAVSFYFVTRKVLEAHREQPVRSGSEELVGARAETRTSLDPEGQVALGGAIWRARLADNEGPLRPGDRVMVEAVDGLTLVVRPDPSSEAPAKGAV
ncbi:MAG TPA: NfeD family protein [Solirubrobacterales bacterium]|jgi:membrane-bound serine protease (ClpP class)|nr:NfeD family protein [Solirubrobacterales bacterium]